MPSGRLAAKAGKCRLNPADGCARPGPTAKSIRQFAAKAQDLRRLQSDSSTRHKSETYGLTARARTRSACASPTARGPEPSKSVVRGESVTRVYVKRTMKAQNTLVVYYSRTGTTRGVAKELAAKLDADIDEIVDRTPREGLTGYLRSGFEAFFQRPTELQPTTRDPAKYDLVVLATPVWNRSVSTPMRAYLLSTRGRITKVAFLLTHDRMGSRRVFRQMEDLALRNPRAVLALRHAEIHEGKHGRKLEIFADRLRTLVATPEAPTPVDSRSRAGNLERLGEAR
jgi:hypothetical protein